MHDATWPSPLTPSHSNPSTMSHSAPSNNSSKTLIVAIGIILALYLAAAAMGWPQAATEMITGGHAAEAGHDAAHAAEHVKPVPALWTVLPFALLLGCIAVLPLMHATEHWWESNLHRFYVAAGLGLITLLYYGFLYHQPIDRHFLGHAVVEPTGSAFELQTVWTVIQNAMFNEFIPFIMLLFALFTISGGIRIEGDLAARPGVNATFLAVGALMASVIGTTGAAMLLIRPLLDTNNERKHIQHTLVFFIFIVCNCGGLLLPLGDPPLFLGYLSGVGFMWTLKLWPMWLFVNGSLIAIYYLWDRFYAYPREEKKDIRKDEATAGKLQFSGVWPNALLLLGVVLAVALLDPSKAVPGTHWHPWLYLREIVLAALIGLSLILGSEKVRNANKFNYVAIIEVAALFTGIFITMQPALQILNARGAELGIDTPHKFFWATGTLSSVLDNAPTYLVFFETAKALEMPADTIREAGVPDHFLVAIALGAVFMGSMTYIGNGPNFMVKSIAEGAGIKMPSFFGYMIFSLAVLLPVFLVMTFLFL
jgi:Na+/H+ antiporter NhaD/arsenite permease-like protein